MLAQALVPLALLALTSTVFGYDQIVGESKLFQTVLQVGRSPLGPLSKHVVVPLDQHECDTTVNLLDKMQCVIPLVTNVRLSVSGPADAPAEIELLPVLAPGQMHRVRVRRSPVGIWGPSSGCSGDLQVDYECDVFYSLT